MEKVPTELIKEWFTENKRNFPWREDASPYRVLVSEVMLQQTQAVVVVPYFKRWMERFPTIEALAQAELDEVIKLWEGLGYYSRARNLHTAAQEITRRHKGIIPSSIESLSAIKGIGPYTLGAIRSFAFHEKTAACDSNVYRLLSRLFAFDKEIERTGSKAHLKALAEGLLCEKEPWLVSEGMIELGAMICTKKPKCSSCPLKGHCLAFRHGLTAELPKKRKKNPVIRLIRQVAVIFCQGHFLVHKEKAGKVMADLYEFPYIEGEEQELVATFQNKLELELSYIKPLATQQHSFTRFRAQLFPHLLHTETRNRAYLWKDKEQIATLPFSSGHRRILQEVLS